MGAFARRTRPAGSRRNPAGAREWEHSPAVELRGNASLAPICEVPLDFSLQRKTTLLTREFIFSREFYRKIHIFQGSFGGILIFSELVKNCGSRRFAKGSVSAGHLIHRGAIPLPRKDSEELLRSTFEDPLQICYPVSGLFFTIPDSLITLPISCYNNHRPTH